MLLEFLTTRLAEHLALLNHLSLEKYNTGYPHGLLLRCIASIHSLHQCRQEQNSNVANQRPHIPRPVTYCLSQIWRERITRRTPKLTACREHRGDPSSSLPPNPTSSYSPWEYSLRSSQELQVQHKRFSSANCSMDSHRTRHSR